MKVTFDNPSQYWKPEVRPQQYESLSEGLIPHSELVVYAKTGGIDPECADWWSPCSKETSRLMAVCLDQCGMDPPVTNYDVLVVRSENGVDVIKGVGTIGVDYKADVSFFGIGLKDYGFICRNDGSIESEAVTKVEFRKRLTGADWNYYKDLMHRSDKALRLFHDYEERGRQERAEEKKRLKPKWIFPLICLSGAGFLFFYGNMDYWFLKAGLIVLLLPTVNAVVKLVRFLPTRHRRAMGARRDCPASRTVDRCICPGSLGRFPSPGVSP